MQLIKQIAVVGAGRMGKTISIAFAYAGLNIQLIDARERDPEEFHIYRQKIISDISQELQLLVSINFIQAAYVETILKRIEVTSRNKSQNFLSHCELVMEAVPELKEIKQEIFKWLDQYLPSECIVASTTSTFLVSEIAQMLSVPERVINAHWLNPAYLMPLVELSRTAETSDLVVERLKAFLKIIGKVPVVCQASAGYIVPRIQALAMNEAARMVEEGVASAEDIDIAIRTGFGLRFSVLGLLEFIDWGGGDILFYASQYLEKELGTRYSAPAIIAENMQNKRNGLREKQGFYNYHTVDIDSYKLQVLKAFTTRIAVAGLQPEPDILKHPVSINKTGIN